LCNFWVTEKFIDVLIIHRRADILSFLKAAAGFGYHWFESAGTYSNVCILLYL
jgi:hypothetical protein